MRSPLPYTGPVMTKRESIFRFIVPRANRAQWRTALALFFVDYDLQYLLATAGEGAQNSAYLDVIFELRSQGRFPRLISHQEAYDIFKKMIRTSCSTGVDAEITIHEYDFRDRDYLQARMYRDYIQSGGRDKHLELGEWDWLNHSNEGEKWFV